MPSPPPKPQPGAAVPAALASLPTRPGDLVLVAYSGGPDSTAVLAGLAERAPELGIAVHAAHFDHRLDPGSSHRALSARGLSTRLKIPFHLGLRPGGAERPAGSPEELARDLRYAFLEELRQRLGARWIVTGHHLDDQAETVLLRMALGTGPEGLAAIRPRRGRILRPLLACRRREILAFLRERDLETIHDPTNDDVSVPRNRLRRQLLPALGASTPDLPERLARLAARALAARQTLRRRLHRELAPVSTFDGIAVRRELLEALPPEVLPMALSLLQHLSGARHPPRRKARDELSRQLAGEKPVGCDAGGGWRWQQQGPWVCCRQPRPATAPFTYTLKVPGSVTIPELGLEVTVVPSPAARLLPTAAPRERDLSLGVPAETSTLLALPLGPGDTVTVRNRLPGDRLRPPGLGCDVRLKEVLINYKVPRPQRDSLPILCIDGNIAWVAGVMTDERFRALAPEKTWLATVKPAGGVPS